MRAALARFILEKIWRWKGVGSPPPTGAVVLCAPHTSNVDYLLMILRGWMEGMTLSFLAKTALFKPPVGWVIKATGGIPVDRSAPQGLVGQMAAAFEANPGMYLCIPAEGTRSRTEYWKSGFYRIAQAADVPISLAYIDRSTRTVGFGPELKPSGDIAADMDLIRDFYDGKIGLKHENFGPVRLREESPGDDAAAG